MFPSYKLLRTLSEACWLPLPLFHSPPVDFSDCCCCCSLETTQVGAKIVFATYANRPVQWAKSNIGSRRSRKSCPQPFSFGDSEMREVGRAKFPAQLCEAARTILIFTSNKTRTPFLCHENCTARHVSGETEIGLTLRKARDSIA